MYPMGGGWFGAWNRALERALLPRQGSAGHARGSWDPVDPWGEEGGRVYSTAINVLTLEVYYRYDRAFR